MTRSTLLQLLAHPTALTGADVRELEQLAKAFPYCQTAHLLLAKAAHDQGSMLAGQRLRRAATYAADRALLRQLIELPAFAEPVLAVAFEEPAELALSAPVSATTSAVALPVTEHLASMSVLAEPETALVEIEADTETESVAAPLSEAAQPEGDVPLPAPALLATETPQPEAELPAQAPPIRPPAEAEAARLEFGLAEEEPAEVVAYQLPELTEPEEVAQATAAPTPPVAAPPAFAGVADVGYVPGEGSRLGFCLQSLATEAYSLTTGPAALLPSRQLPPTGDFFAPDALLLAHLAAHQASAAPVLASAPVASDLINSFLRRSPQASSRRRPLPPPDVETEEQPDLAEPSTLAVPDLASESLAKILARQGKTDRAIAIYERLMVKQPEKMAYFAAQIDSLRPQA